MAHVPSDALPSVRWYELREPPTASLCAGVRQHELTFIGRANVRRRSISFSAKPSARRTVPSSRLPSSAALKRTASVMG